MTLGNKRELARGDVPGTSHVILALVLLTFALLCHSAAGMAFHTEWREQDGINVIVGEGPIEHGDAERLEKVSPLAGQAAGGGRAQSMLD